MIAAPDNFPGWHETPEGPFVVAYLRRPNRHGWYWAGSGPAWYGPFPTAEAAYEAALYHLTPTFD